MVVEKMGIVLSNFSARERVGGCATRIERLFCLRAELRVMKPRRSDESRDEVEVVYGFSPSLPQSRPLSNKSIFRIFVSNNYLIVSPKSHKHLQDPNECPVAGPSYCQNSTLKTLICHLMSIAISNICHFPSPIQPCGNLTVQGIQQHALSTND